MFSFFKKICLHFYIKFETKFQLKVYHGFFNFSFQNKIYSTYKFVNFNLN